MVYTSVCCGAALAVLCVAGEPAVLNILFHWKKRQKRCQPFPWLYDRHSCCMCKFVPLRSCFACINSLCITGVVHLALGTSQYGANHWQGHAVNETRHACVFIYRINLDITLMKCGCPLMCFFFVLSFLLMATFWCSHPCSVLVYYRLFLNKCSKLRWQVGSALSRDCEKCYTAMRRAQGLYHLISCTTTLCLNSALLSR